MILGHNHTWHKRDEMSRPHHSGAAYTKQADSFDTLRRSQSTGN